MIQTLLEAVMAVAIPIVAKYLMDYLNAKSAEAKASTNNILMARYLDNVTEAVVIAIESVSQTFTDKMRDENGKLTREQAQYAMTVAISVAKSQLSSEVQSFVNEVYGDINKYLTDRIEAELHIAKGA
jgi:DNA topoisomerase VI subunit B